MSFGIVHVRAQKHGRAGNISKKQESGPVFQALCVLSGSNSYGFFMGNLSSFVHMDTGLSAGQSWKAVVQFSYGISYVGVAFGVVTRSRGPHGRRGAAATPGVAGDLGAHGHGIVEAFDGLRMCFFQVFLHPASVHFFHQVKKQLCFLACFSPTYSNQHQHHSATGPAPPKKTSPPSHARHMWLTHSTKPHPRSARHQWPRGTSAP